MMFFLNFMNGVYWGQLSKCQEFPHLSIPHYSCSQRSAYGAVAAFSILLFLFQLSFTVLLYLWRNEFVQEYEAVTSNDYSMSSHSSGSNRSREFSAYLPPQKQQPPQSLNEPQFYSNVSANV
jgi:hypothetical protein